MVEAAQEFLDVVFPRGLAVIIRQSFEAQLATMEVMLEHFEGDLSEHVELLGLDREVARMKRLVDEFRIELARTQSPRTTYLQVTEAREELHEYLCMAAILIIAAYPESQRLQ